ncbi:MAG: metallophosphoesterase [Patescibacteria group bacterium]|nr:metallophosphoesterase [Patescibacteria group bacterium]
MNLIKVLICPDTHFPYHSKPEWKTFLKVAEVWRPDKFVFLGDGVDNYCVSRFLKDPRKKLPLEKEVELANREFDKVSALGIEDVTYLEGNHEVRLEKYLINMGGELLGIVDIKKLLKIKERGWNWKPYGHYHSIGKLNFVHDVGYAGINASRMSVQKFGGNIIFGHTHQAQTTYTSSLNGDCHVGHTMGWLGDKEYVDYGTRVRIFRETQLGFGIAYVRKNDGIGWSQFVPIIKGTACVEGQFIRG